MDRYYGRMQRHLCSLWWYSLRFYANKVEDIFIAGWGSYICTPAYTLFSQSKPAKEDASRRGRLNVHVQWSRGWFLTWPKSSDWHVSWQTEKAKKWWWRWKWTTDALFFWDLKGRSDLTNYCETWAQNTSSFHSEKGSKENRPKFVIQRDTIYRIARYNREIRYISGKT